MGDRYVTREHKGAFGGRYLVTTREKTAAEENAEIAKGIGTAVGVAGLLIGGMVKQHQDNKYRQLEMAANQGFDAINSADYDQGLEIGTRLIKMGGKEAKALGFTIAGMALGFLERYDEAIQHLTSALDGLQALGEGQNAGNLYIHRGTAYLGKNDLSSAIRDFTTYIKLNPNEDTGYYHRALSLQRLNDPDQALIDFAKAITLNPSDAANYRERGTLYAALNQPEKALEDYSRAITLAPKSAYNYKLRGKLYAATSNYAKAIDDFTQAIALRQSDSESLQLRAAAYQSIGEDAKAQTDLEQVNSLADTLDIYQAYRQTADTLYQQGFKVWFTQADTTAKTRIGMVAGGIGVLLLPFLCIGMAPMVYRDMGVCLILMGFITGGLLVAGAFFGPRNKAKQAVALLTKVDECEREKPGFSLFYEQYLAARKQGNLNDLPEQIVSLRSKSTGAPAHAAPAHATPGRNNSWICSSCGGYVRHDATFCKHCKLPFQASADLAGADLAVKVAHIFNDKINQDEES